MDSKIEEPAKQPEEKVLTGNAGEWSEVYVFFSILGDRAIFPCDADLNREQETAIPVIEIRRGEGKQGNLAYRFSNSPNARWEIYEGGECKGVVTPEEGRSEADSLLEELRGALKNKGGSALTFPKALKFLRMLHSSSLKAKALEKKDIELTIDDVRAGGEVACGFSIKSYISGAPTLLNASARTLFEYKVTGLDDEAIEEINQNRIGLIVSSIEGKGGRIAFAGMNSQYRKNLMFIDSSMPELVSGLLLQHFRSCGSTPSTERRKVKDTTKVFAEKDQMGWNNSALYDYKMKKFMEATALGMLPSKPWEGIEEANGGFIVVKPKGEIVTFHIYNRNVFMDYLFNHTKFETPSTSRYECGKLVKTESGECVLRLPLQIRFCTDS